METDHVYQLDGNELSIRVALIRHRPTDTHCSEFPPPTNSLTSGMLAITTDC
jgi:hypothetical protein